MSKTIFYFDTETTGLDPNRHGIVQIAWIIELKPGGRISSPSRIERCFDVKLDDNTDINMKALEVNGFTLERLSKGVPKEVVLNTMHNDILEAMKGGQTIIPCGHNVSFDIDFLMAMIQKTDHKYTLNFGERSDIQFRKPLCTKVMAHFLDYRGILSLQNYKLTTLTKHFGISHDKAHDALGDVAATVELSKTLIKLINEGVPS